MGQRGRQLAWPQILAAIHQIAFDHQADDMAVARLQLLRRAFGK